MGMQRAEPNKKYSNRIVRGRISLHSHVQTICIALWRKVADRRIQNKIYVVIRVKGKLPPFLRLCVSVIFYLTARWERKYSHEGKITNCSEWKFWKLFMALRERYVLKGIARYRWYKETDKGSARVASRAIRRLWIIHKSNKLVEVGQGETGLAAYLCFVPFLFFRTTKPSACDEMEHHFNSFWNIVISFLVET